MNQDRGRHHLIKIMATRAVNIVKKRTLKKEGRKDLAFNFRKEVSIQQSVKD